MTTNLEVYVGIHVSKDDLDLAVLSKRSVVQFATTKKGLARLVRHLKPLQPKFIVVEATGG